MKEKIMMLLVLGLFLAGTASAATIVLDDPSATSSTGVIDTAHAYIGGASWANDGAKFELYLPASAFFEGGFTVGDIERIEYHTYKDDAQAGLNFYLSIYTEPYVGGFAGWYGERLTLEPMYSYNFVDTIGSWNDWSTDAGTNQLTLYDSNRAGAFGWYYPPTLAQLQAGNVNWNDYFGGAPVTDIDYASQPVLYVVIDTGNPWAATFEGSVDALTVILKNGSATTFDLDADSDGDGVTDGNDLCADTEADDDVPAKPLGVNRWVWNGETWETKAPRGKNLPGEWNPNFSPTIDDTYGCNCEQILDSMSETLGMDFGGHYKYGCSKSVVEDWISGRYYIGPTLVETVEVPANDADGVTSLATLELGKDYFLNAYGTAFACNVPGCVIEFDAEYSTSDNTTWVDGVAAPYDFLGPDLLDLMVDGGFVNWGAYNALHTYQLSQAGTGSALSLLINDVDYPSNTGSLFVDIIEDKWADLW